MLGLSYVSVQVPERLNGSKFLGSGLRGGGSEGLYLSGSLWVTLELAMGMSGSVVESHYLLCVDVGCVGHVVCVFGSVP